ncbi:MAG: hypothetical protein SFW66_00425 [Gammaproteobacteria bacterium]|nr:hypothetical protein [Gammaproteobacteria bacterium]
MSYINILCSLSCCKSAGNDSENEESQTDASGQNINSIFKEIHESTDAIAKELKEWEQIELDLLKEFPEFIHLPEAPDAKILTEHETFFNKLILTIIDAIEPAEEEIQDLIQHTNEIIEKRFEMLDKACSKANNSRLAYKERAKARMEICRDSMAILNDEIALLNGIKAELQYSINTEKLSEKIIGFIIGLVVLILAKIPLPTTLFSFAKEYQNHLYNNVKDEAQELLLIRAGIQNELNKAKDAVEPPAVKMEKAVVALPGKVSALMQSLFSKQNRKEKEEKPIEQESKGLFVKIEYNQ